MCRRRDLRERAEREPPGALDDHCAREFARRFERQAVLGVRGGGPVLLPALVSGSRSVAQRQQGIPLPTRCELVDLSEQLFELGIGNVGQTRGQG